MYPVAWYMLRLFIPSAADWSVMDSGTKLPTFEANAVELLLTFDKPRLT
jgi:hypothetical protein